MCACLGGSVALRPVSRLAGPAGLMWLAPADLAAEGVPLSFSTLSTASHPPAGPLQWLDELLPEDAAERCRGRVRLIVTEVGAGSEAGWLGATGLMGLLYCTAGCPNGCFIDHGILFLHG